EPISEGAQLRSLDLSRLAGPSVAGQLEHARGDVDEAGMILAKAAEQCNSSGANSRCRKASRLYCRDFKLGARHSTLQAQVDLGHPDVPVRIVPCGCDASIRYRRS